MDPRLTRAGGIAMFVGITASCGVVMLPDAMTKDEGCPAVGCPPPPGPQACYLPAGTCEDGACSDTFNDGAACDDGDDCTLGDTCARGACRGTPALCDDPGPPVCIDGSTRQSYGAGSCSAGGCTYLPTDEACPQGCAKGQCNAVRPAVTTGFGHTCALSSEGSVRCWGYNDQGQLGYGHTQRIGDDETPASSGDVDVGVVVTQISAGDRHTCALLDTGAVRCWGQQTGDGRLGYGNGEIIGDDETPSSAGDVNVGGPVKQIAAGGTHTCALLTSGKVRCWGRGDLGALGYGNKKTIGDDETPATAGDVDVGGEVSQVSASYWGTCALLTTGSVRCWGYNLYGQLGYGNTGVAIGDDETPASVGDVPLGGRATQIASDGYEHACALMEGGSVRCWGNGFWGALGYGNTETIGDNETPESAGDVDVGDAAVQITTGWTHTCARLQSGSVRCWGNGTSGQLGYGGSGRIGDDESPGSVGVVQVGEDVTGIESGAGYTCVVRSTGSVRCWGDNREGQLGAENTNNIYDPAKVVDVPIW